MLMRAVAGVRQGCLQLLPESELEQLQLPPARGIVVMQIHYLEGDRNFAGEPTHVERLGSFKVRDTMHCGWCSGNGFDIDVIDTTFMKTCCMDTRGSWQQLRCRLQDWAMARCASAECNPYHIAVSPMLLK